MVAPTRTPQARGAKCDICKKILTSATWLDQTKLAKEVDDAQNVLSLIKQHNTTDCPCIPKSIENLLVGSTHFEIHRLTFKKLDLRVHRRQYECCMQSKHKTQNNSSEIEHEILNDCNDNKHRESRFRTYSGYDDPEHLIWSKEQLKHLCRAIDSWRIALEDPTHPFNAKLALRLGLTHHIIYACYLYKYFKMLDYQLITANLLLNVFRSIEGVTANAILHAYYLLIKSLIDSDHFQLARYYLKQATKMPNYNDKSYYESILLTCAECELGLLDGSKNGLDELSELVYIQPDDKLQHYYARTLAITLIIRYIHIYPSKSDSCSEFFHAFRFTCAIMRRCYESSFELVMLEKNANRRQSKGSQDKTQVQVLDHSWIRFAVSDFVFSTFDLLCEFHTRAGMPECLELIYNALTLISFRSGSLYWQSRIQAIGVELDLLCDIYDSARAKVDITSRLVGYSDDTHLMNVTRLYSELGLLQVINQQESVITDDVIVDLLDRAKACKRSLMQRLTKNDLYDAKSGTYLKMNSGDVNYDHMVIYGYLGKLSFTALRVGLKSLLRQSSDQNHSLDLMAILRNQLLLTNDITLEFNTNQQILEMLVELAGIEKSQHILLDILPTSPVFIEVDDRLPDIQSQLSSLTISSEIDNRTTQPAGELFKKAIRTKRTNTSSKIPLSRRSKRKGTYNVAAKSEENSKDNPPVRLFNVVETILNFSTLTKEETIVSYLRNADLNPDFNYYRRAHELMLCHRLSDNHLDHEAILYHMSESVTANTLRYRWMMYEEQNTSPYDHSCGDKTQKSPTPGYVKHLSFCNSLINHANIIKTMTRSIPDDTRLVQLKYIYDRSSNLEHLLCVTFGQNQEPVYIHSKRTPCSDDAFLDTTRPEFDPSSLTIPSRMEAKIEESRQSLLSMNHRSRTNVRREIESRLEVILHDAESDWLGAFRFMICGKITDASYIKFVNNLANDVINIMGNRLCRSPAALRMLLEYAPLLRRDEFCQALATIFNCDTSSIETRDCFNKWLKSLELNLKEQNIEMNKTAFLTKLERGQIGLILDNKLELIPFESLPVIRTIGQGMFRVPSLRLFSILATRHFLPVRIDTNETAYMLDPAHDLAKTRERFDCKLKSQKNWVGTIGCAPLIEDLESWMSSKQLYLYIGHGAGTIYYNKLCNGKGLGHMKHIESAAIVMGCSSGRMMSESSRLESFGFGWLIIIRGSPCYLGLLWDVTDNDIDKFLDAMLDKWMPGRRWSSVVSPPHPSKISLTTASTLARQVCQLKLLVGSSPVIYGLPIWCND